MQRKGCTEQLKVKSQEFFKKCQQDPASRPAAVGNDLKKIIYQNALFPYINLGFRV